MLHQVPLTPARLSRRSCRASASAVAAPATPLYFVKYQGIGNDFILVDNRGSATRRVTPQQAVQLCDRHTGVGADGVILALPAPPGADLAMVVLNSDGSESEMCGNGIRCLARFVASLDGSGPRSFAVATGAGLITPELLADFSVRVDMGAPVLAPALVPTTLVANHPSGAAVATPLTVAGEQWSVSCVSMGNPHCVAFVAPGGGRIDLDALPLSSVGPAFETHAAFPRKTNVHFVEVQSRTSLRVRVWERGAGITQACGTGACAVLVAAVLEGRADRSATVHLPGGALRIEWWEADNRVFMTGPAEAVFSGVLA